MAIIELVSSLLCDRTMPSIQPLFVREQRTLLEMMEAVAETDHEDPIERADTFAELRLELIAHLRAVEETVFPALEAVDPVDDYTWDLSGEHETILQKLQELTAIVHQDHHWMRRFLSLQARVVALFQNVERELPGRVRRLLSTREEAAVVAAYGRSRSAVRKELQGRKTSPWADASAGAYTLL